MLNASSGFLKIPDTDSHQFYPANLNSMSDLTENVTDSNNQNTNGMINMPLAPSVGYLG